ncbi:MAG: hypothetical protein H0V65_05450 [Chitinophagales bacterium]|nr:hypothetical protein [Chitinophagales bacterium]
MRNRGKVLITETCDALLIEGLHVLGFGCSYQPGISQKEVEKDIHHYTGVIVATRVVINKKVIESGKLLKFIARAGSGMENIETVFAASKNIYCINSPEGNANSVAEHCMGLLLGFYHNITKSYLEMQQSKWLVQENQVQELEGRWIGLIGYGNTGKAFARKLSILNMNVLAYDKYLENYSDAYAKAATINDLYKHCEIISLHIPQNAETLEIVNSDFLGNFSRIRFLINTSRGKLINHSHLLENILNKNLAGAALDVFENENFESHTQKQHQVFQALIKTGKVIVTPHIAGKSLESKHKIAQVLLNKIKAIL